MLSARITRWLAVTGAVSCLLPALAQTGSTSDRGYTMTLPVDEVALTFHASAAHGQPVNDIRADEIKVLDNGTAPGRIIAFNALLDRPLRAAILLDTSESMERALPRTRDTASRFAGEVFRPGTDQGYVTQFGYSSVVVRPWTGDSAAIVRSIQGIHVGQANPLPGTALIDSIFRTCLYGFGTADPSATGNVILLFSDGEDISSHTTTDEALRACQRSNTVIYAFRTESASGSPGPSTLAELTAKTGGRVFPADSTDDTIANDLHIIESEMRNQYRLVYHPAQFKHDGAFHSIELQLPDRVTRVEVRTGYFAPEH
ncbi:VWA domain-containing protein [Occallatibacter riparius]|uniref:VWA domain-containing protein n=1 Tax=Occallatibacter riparius TaxID=1002689 RepID=A0A9J7BN50_9BACT|nr:VWA domain-containing protein [Occallatibacter riparius]UWZ84316.1 VWA domain-containing protein [Occallatibacter riparius]